MSLDVDIYCDHCNTVIFSANVSHNKVDLATHAGVYDCLWRMEEEGITQPVSLIERLSAGIDRLQAIVQSAERDSLIRFLARLLDACRLYPYLSVRADR